jgi:hypothetical protein
MIKCIVGIVYLCSALLCFCLGCINTIFAIILGPAFLVLAPISPWTVVVFFLLFKIGLGGLRYDVAHC